MLILRWSKLGKTSPPQSRYTKYIIAWYNLLWIISKITLLNCNLQIDCLNFLYVYFKMCYNAKCYNDYMLDLIPADYFKKFQFPHL